VRLGSALVSRPPPQRVPLLDTASPRRVLKIEKLNKKKGCVDARNRLMEWRSIGQLGQEALVVLTSTLVTSHRQVLPRNRIFTPPWTSGEDGLETRPPPPRLMEVSIIKKKKGVIPEQGDRGPLTLGNKKRKKGRES